MLNLEFFNNRRVFLTGHTGFKGSWLCRILLELGAEVTGYALEPATEPDLFTICEVEDKMISIIGDIRDKEKLFNAFSKAKPEIVIHMAAQPIVRDSYKDPAYTYDVNVMGTVNILECVRKYDGVRSFLNVTTDKVYFNNEWHWGYRETDRLDGYDPYSNSKSCSELVTGSYRNAFFSDGKTAISTARAGNVVGGGDFATDRIIPDCVRAAIKKEAIIVRNPHSIRPYQHVLEPLFSYLMIAQKQYEDIKYAGCYNVGPDDADCVSTGDLVEIFCNTWGEDISWENKSTGGPHEASFLKLDCSKLKAVFGWKPCWNVTEAVEKTVEWTRVFLTKSAVCDIMNSQIQSYINAQEQR
jgi:CDP-glucose 4,6-dehydratase